MSGFAVADVEEKGEVVRTVTWLAAENGNVEFERNIDTWLLGILDL